MKFDIKKKRKIKKGRMEPYLQVTINKCLDDPIWIYAFVVTTYKIYRWNKRDKPTKKDLVISYILSFGSRYIFYPFYIFTDAYGFCDNICKMLSDRDIRIV